MKRRKKARTMTVTLSAEDSNRLAAACCPLYDMHISEGMKLAGNSRLWKRRDGSWTARFVYRDPGDPGWTTTTFVKGLVFQ